MKMTFKSIFKLMSVGFISLAVLSCSKSDTEPVQEKALGFNTYTGRAVSKADASFIGKGSTALLDNSKFVVYAYNTGSAAWNGTATNVFMNAVTVTYAGGAPTDPEKYTYSPLRYWPNDEANNKLSFFAYYPQGGTGITAANNGWGAYTFTAQTDPKNMVDFLVSEVAPDQTYSATNSKKPGVVNMKFYHTLTIVKFKVKTDKEYTGTTITLKSISLAGVNTVGTLTPANTTSAWSAQGTPATFNVFPEGTKALNTTAVFVPTGTEKDDAYLMSPQRLSDDVVATITYTVQTEGDAATTNTATVKLNTSDVKAWEMNKNIVYTFVVGLKPIQFIAEVNDWDDVTGADFNVGF